jgi:type IX secretion system PorP/SprF family membrane protein
MKASQSLLTLLFVLVVSAAMAQDIHFSQFYMSPLNLNPALTGVMNCNQRVVANYRNQWSSVLKSNAYNTYSASYDQKIPVGRNDNFGVGGTLWGDKAGELNFSTLQARFSGSYHKKMGGYRHKAHYLVVGADVGLSQRNIDVLKARWPSQNDPSNSGTHCPTCPGEDIARPNFLFADLSAGLLWFTVLNRDGDNFYIGAAFNHMNRANQSFGKDEYIPLYSKLTFHAGSEFMVGNRVGLVPGVVALIQGPSFEMNAGCSMKFLLGNSRRNHQAFQVGAWTRIAHKLEKGNLMDALILSTRFDYEDFTLGFSYDLNTSSLRPASNSNGAFEFSLVYKICGPEKRGVYCPSF